MEWYNWLIVVIPVAFVLGMALYARRYIRDVVDYLSAGRVAGRFLLATGDLAAALGLITLVGNCEANYKTGFAVGYWQTFFIPIFIFINLSGYCIYRFRETRAMTIGQFLEMRYSRNFRVFATILRTSAELLTNAIGPAIAARFFMYLFNWPAYVDVCGFRLNVYMTLIVVSLLLAIFIIWSGGMIALILTDSLQAILCYPIFLVIVGFIIWKFSWDGQITPVLYDRVPGESFLNPFDVENLRDFNIFALIVGFSAWILNWASWYGSGQDSSARSPHEQKMAGVLGTWRGGFSSIMLFLIMVSVIVFMNHQDFSPQAKVIRDNLSARAAAEIIADPAERADFIRSQQAIPEQKHRIGVDQPLSIQQNLDTPYMENAKQFLVEKNGDAKGNSMFQEFRTLYNQTRLPVAMQTMLPGPLLAIFCVLAIMLMLSTDDSRIFASARTLSQDIVLPFLKKPPTVKQQLWLIRGLSLFVALVFFLGSFFFSQLDYINLYITIMASIWTGGAGAVMIGGLYSRFGTTQGAYASLLTGAGFSIGGIILQRSWARHVYPFLDRMGWVDALGSFLETVSSPLNPYVVWKMDPVKFPVNSTEIFAITILASILAYVLISFLTLKRPFNLEWMLHRGEYNDEGKCELKEKWTLRTVFRRLVGISPEYTRGDKALAWSVFCYSFVWNICIVWAGSLIWNLISPWKLRGWSNYFWVVNVVVPGIIGVITSIWFTWGGIRDIRQLFVDLKKRIVDYRDNGMVDKSDLQ